MPKHAQYRIKFPKLTFWGSYFLTTEFFVKSFFSAPLFEGSGSRGEFIQEGEIFPKFSLLTKPKSYQTVAKLRVYSFCAVFLFRFIYRNRNRREQKERLSFERNNFHGNQNGALFDFKLKRTKVRKHSLRSFSSVFERVFMVTSREWRAAAVLTAVLFEGKL